MSFLDLRKSQPARKSKLEYFRKKILDHLSMLEKKETKAVNKALNTLEIMKGGYAVGTIRTWKGKDYVKIAPGKWRPKYDSHTRGAKMAVSAIKKRISAAKDEHEMMQICLANRDRFSDKNGHPLPFMQELHNYIEEQKEVKAIVARNKTAREKRDPKNGFVRFDNDKRIGLQKKPASNYTGGTQSSRLNRVKDDYAAGKIDFDTTVKEYMAIYPKLSKKDAEKTVQRVFKQPSQKTVKPETGKDETDNEILVRIKKKFVSFAVPMEKHDFSPETYKKLFPNGKVNTPLGDVKLGNNQYQKLEAKGRKDYLGAVFQTLSDPIVIVEAERNGKKAKLYSKSFKESENTQIVISVVVDVKGKPISISTHRREMNNTLNIIKKGNILFEKNAAPTVDTRTFNSSSSEERQPTDKVSPESGEKSSDYFAKIQSKYQSAKAVEGDEDEVQIGKEALAGKWKLVEADTPTASHNEMTFQKTRGFPANADGSSINDRDYEHFEANKEAVLNIASDFDGRALKFDSPVVVTTDGVVISGNNRTMSSKIAAKKGTDKKYIEALQKRAKKFGFTEDQVKQFKNPRVVFEVEQKGEYSTAQFAKFNESGKKEMGPTEKAAKVSKMIKTNTIETVAKKIDEFDTIGELYQDRNASYHIFTAFRDAGLIGENETGRYFENGALTDDGKTFIETALLGTVINEANLRGFNRPGCKSIRSMLMRALIPLVENKGMSGYSINKELNEAADIAMQVAIEKDKFKNVDEFSRQKSMFESFDPIAVGLAKKMEGTQKAFAEFMRGMNGGLKVAANGEVDIFLGKIEDRDEILGRFLEIKKAVMEVLGQIPETALVKSISFLEG